METKILTQNQFEELKSSLKTASMIALTLERRMSRFTNSMVAQEQKDAQNAKRLLATLNNCQTLIREIENKTSNVETVVEIKTYPDTEGDFEYIEEDFSD